MPLRDFKYSVDGWVGQIPFNKPESGTSSVCLKVRGPRSITINSGLDIVRDLDKNYFEVWSGISRRIIEMCHGIRNEEELISLLRPDILISVPGIVSGEDIEEFDFLLIYETVNFGSCAFGFNSWKVESAFLLS